MGTGALTTDIEYKEERIREIVTEILAKYPPELQKKWPERNKFFFWLFFQFYDGFFGFPTQIRRFIILKIQWFHFQKNDDKKWEYCSCICNKKITGSEKG